MCFLYNKFNSVNSYIEQAYIDIEFMYVYIHTKPVMSVGLVTESLKLIHASVNHSEGRIR